MFDFSLKSRDPRANNTSMDNSEHLQSFLRDKMIQRGLSIRALAAKAGVNYTVLYNVLNGKTLTIQDKTLKKLSDALNLSIDDLWVANAGGQPATVITGLAKWTAVQPSEIQVELLGIALKHGFQLWTVLENWADQQPPVVQHEIVTALEKHGYKAPKTSRDMTVTSIEVVLRALDKAYPDDDKTSKKRRLRTLGKDPEALKRLLDDYGQ